jgi:probable phosphoglycerate mutase
VATKIYLVRHGQSKANELDLFLGHGDLDLTEKGLKQAQLASKYLSTLKIDVIYSSDLMRAYHTSLPTAKLLNLSVNKEKGLREIDCGEWDFMKFDDLRVKFKESFDVWVDNVADARCDGGESVEEVQNRMVETIKKIAKENYGKNVLIFSHATSIRCFAGYCTGKGKYGIQEIPWANNCSLTEVEYEDGNFRLIEYGKDDYLKGLTTSLPNDV